MGFFSWDCKVCGHPLLSDYAVNREGVDNSWMTDVVVIETSGSILHGKYDGYGRVEEHDIEHDCGRGLTEPQCYHKACWHLAGRPVGYNEGSTPSRDQGYFFGTEHDMPEPCTFKDALGSKP
jgi:hypothetical protein